MINDPTLLIFDFGAQPQRISSTSLENLIEELRKLFSLCSDSPENTSLEFYHVAAPTSGSLRFPFSLAFRASASGQEGRLPSPNVDEWAASAVNANALFQAVFGERGLYDVEVNKSPMPTATRRAEIVSRLIAKDAVSSVHLESVRRAAIATEAEDIFIQVPDEKRVMLASKHVPREDRNSTVGGHTFDGTWDITINSPMGAQKVTATIISVGNTFTGTTRTPAGEQRIVGEIRGDEMLWNTKITQPMPMTLEFSATLNKDGTGISGKVKLGAFGSAPLTGVRSR